MSEKKLTGLLISRSEAEQRINSRIKEGYNILHIELFEYPDLEDWVDKWEIWHGFNVELLKRVFDTPEYAEDYGLHTGLSDALSADWNDAIDYITTEMKDKLRYLRALQAKIPLIDELTTTVNKQKKKEPKSISSNVFIVHGQDESTKDKLAYFLKKLDINPIILHEQAGEGQTLIEKFETHSSYVSYAVVLLTPDDKGARAVKEAPLKSRARQNVIFELGYFVGQLGRKRVCALYDKSVDLPSDWEGVCYVELTKNDDWKHKVAKEMQAAGLDIDLNKV